MTSVSSVHNFKDDKERDIFILQSVRSLCEGNNHYISNAANISALLFEYIPNINWIGFYFLHNNILHLGPF
ncbi:MAG TPA: GAF domain-containing protein, partial [Candidatus Kapabacteria bacterium]|nr:GAF domain-containing protein [Candidatus Kapabacteria bacterium]